MRNKFDRQLQILEEQLIHMGELCESAIANATKALSDGSIEQAKAVINESVRGTDIFCNGRCNELQHSLHCLRLHQSHVTR